MKKCPFCAEEIRDEAVVCKHCGRDLRTTVSYGNHAQQYAPLSASQQPVKKNSNTCLVITLVMLSLAGMCFFAYGLGLATMDEEAAYADELHPRVLSQEQPNALPPITASGGSAAGADNSARSKAAVQSAALPTSTPFRVSMAEIERSHQDLTEVQWKEYAAALIGKRVHWTGVVREVEDDGTIYLDAEQDLFHSVFINGFPMKVVKTFNKGQVIEFEATIEDVTTFLGLSIWLKTPVLISVR